LDHRYNADFIKHLQAEAKWAIRHHLCLHDLAHRRPGTHTCKACGRTPELDRRCVSVLVNGAATPLSLHKRRGGAAYGYVCPCGTEQSCSCPAVAINFTAQLVDRMLAVDAHSVAQTDPLVEGFTDDEAALYGTVRDAFLKAQHIRYRTIERVRQAAVDDKTSQGGEFVYFVSSEDGRIKIGTSANVEKRMTALQTSSAVKLTLLLTIPGSTDLETELHRRFTHLRESGEWFTAAPELRFFVEGAAYYKALGSSAHKS
jgi:hypothetical protein